MNILVIGWIHPKNKHALLMYNKFNIIFIEIEYLNYIHLNNFDIIYSPSIPINVSKYPNTKFLFGPHFDVFPNKNMMDMIRNSKHVIYTQPSNWTKNIWTNSNICNNIRIEIMPFGVDTVKFDEIKLIEERNKVFLYFKHRHPTELNIMVNFLKSKNIDVKIFDYDSKYSENDYIDYLHESKFGIWIGCHESQGFALEEALSCNVPLFVWNVNYMDQEYGYNYPENISATSIPYWNDSCGESFTNIDDIECKYDCFIKNLKNYNPRNFVLNYLSIEKCQNNMINILKQI